MIKQLLVSRKTILFILTLCVSAITTTVSAQKIVENTPWGEETFTYPTIGNKEFVITSFGAESKAGVNNQEAIQKAIDKCNSSGGGLVIIPAGEWETSYLTLKSNVNLHLKKGAVLSFLDDIELYKTPTFTRWEGIECLNYHPLIYARDEHDVAITGEGKIVGNGKNWWQFKRPQIKTLEKLYAQVLNNVPAEQRNCFSYGTDSYLRPSLIQFFNSKNVWVDGIEIGSGPMWTVHFVYCENVIAQNLKVITQGVNNDGIIPDASKKVLIDNCFFSTGDDCIVIKSGLNEDGWRVGKPSERIVIKNCNTDKGHGGVVIGSEMSGGVENIYAYDCNFSNTERGLRIKSMKGRGGYVKNLWMQNIKMDNMQSEAIKINMKYNASSIMPKGDETPVFSNFNFENISSSNSRACINIIGLDNQKIEGMSFKNIKMHGGTGINISNAENCKFDHIEIEVENAEPIKLSDCKKMDFDTIKLKSESKTMVRLSGDNSDIVIKNSNKEDYQEPVSEEKPSNIQIK